MMSLSSAVAHFGATWQREAEMEKVPQPIGKGWTRFHEVEGRWGTVVFRHDECNIEIRGPKMTNGGTEGSWMSVSGPYFETSAEQDYLLAWIAGEPVEVLVTSEKKIRWEPEVPYRLELHPAYPGTVKRLAVKGRLPNEYR